MRESAEQKGRRYLTEGRLVVLAVDRRKVEAACRGEGDDYRVRFDPDRQAWRCSCPARGRCAHLVALRLVTRKPR